MGAYCVQLKNALALGKRLRGGDAFAQRLPGPPLLSLRRDIRAALFVGVYRFF